MRGALYFALFTVVALPIVAKADGAAKDQARFQGEWRVLASSAGKVSTTASIRVTFSGPKMTLKHGDTVIEAEFTLDTSQEPKGIHFQGKKEAEQSNAPDEFAGVYKFEGNLLVLHIGEKRPEGFQAKDTKTFLMVLEKVPTRKQ